jgi:hypothetical protein
MNALSSLCLYDNGEHKVNVEKYLTDSYVIKEVTFTTMANWL